MDNSVYKSLLSCFSLIHMWITLYPIIFKIRQFCHFLLLFCSSCTSLFLSRLLFQFFIISQYLKKSYNRSFINNDFSCVKKIIKKGTRHASAFRVPLLHSLEDTPDGKNLHIIRIGYDDAGFGIGCMHNLSVADI